MFVIRAHQTNVCPFASFLPNLPEQLPSVRLASQTHFKIFPCLTGPHARLQTLGQLAFVLGAFGRSFIRRRQQVCRRQNVAGFRSRCHYAQVLCRSRVDEHCDEDALADVEVVNGQVLKGRVNAACDFEDGVAYLLEALTERLTGLPDDVGVEKRMSGIVDAGHGVFATRDFMAGDIVLIYGGEVISEKSARDEAGKAGYTIETEEGQYIDGRLNAAWLHACPLALGQYCNHPSPGARPNLMIAALPSALPSSALGDINPALRRWLPRQEKSATAASAPVLLLIAADDVSSGDELLFDYQLDPNTAPNWYSPVD
eukprot:TRINITY_DN105373_c0_g1_i1.p1 TRINITY_DN105373_c0_g1~~TRINITY_DN105373_c0_g1_i1.p1  ORF type:complete len:314 (+),score=48.31 TRINITY_DN105373_c0_g1_i1:41-982(+)